MLSDEDFYIKEVKKQIENQLGWPSSDSWKQRDYLNLIDLIDKKSEINLSLSTIKRIWKPDYKGSPHPSTLNAFALFLGYKNWLNFKENNSPSLNEQQETTSTKEQRFKKSLLPIMMVVLISVIGVFIIQSNKSVDAPESVQYDANDIKFSSKNATLKGVPNTVIFDYNISSVQADSFYIQQNWNALLREKIQPENQQFTTMYYYPGVHQAKLIANDSIIKETPIRINTNGWLAFARYNYTDKIPVYFRDEIQKDGVLSVSKQQLAESKIDLSKNPIVSYYCVDNFTGLSSGNFTFETRLKCDSVFNITCPYVFICLLGEYDMNIIPLTTKGCVGNVNLKFGDTTHTGKNHDLSVFGAEVYQWQDLKVEARNNKAIITINEHQKYEIPFSKDIGEVTGISFNFTGTGSVDYVRLLNGEKKLIFNDEFETNL
ncbi:MAG: hypothetical protein CMO01_02620 [Thalassobius sp.]|nr:hypothetical protein [Thalassovita sp.]